MHETETTIGKEIINHNIPHHIDSINGPPSQFSSQLLVLQTIRHTATNCAGRCTLGWVAGKSSVKLRILL
jgi:hypothetical protein